MLNIEEAIYDTYIKNIEYIKQNHPQLQKLLEFFELALENGDYQTEYELEYNDDYFEVIQLKDARPLYGRNSLTISQEIVKKMNKSKSSFTFEAVPTTKFSDEFLKNFKELHTVELLSKYLLDNDTQNGTMEDIEKFIVIGTGLGIHIPELHNKLYPQHYLIVEDNLEIFRLSMFTTKYYELGAAAEITFSIGTEANDFEVTVKEFLEENYFYNRFIKYYLFPNHSNDKILQIKSAILGQNFAVYPYRAALRKLVRPLEYLNNGYKSLKVFDNRFKASIVSQKPLLVLGAGPSFTKNMTWLEENYKKYIIIAVSAVLPSLYTRGIKPDIVTHVDSADITLKFYDELDEDYLSNTAMVFHSQISTKLRNKFRKEQIYFLEDNYSYYNNSVMLSGPCVGSTSVMLALSLYAKNIYLLGIDLALDQETGGTHSSEHKFAKEVDLTQKQKNSPYMTMDSDTYEVEANFQDKVITNVMLGYSLKILNRVIPEIIQKEQNIYNLSDGAKIQNTISLRSEDIDENLYQSMDKDVVRESLLSVFSEVSYSKLNDAEIELVKKRADFARKVSKKINLYIEQETAQDYKKYLSDLLGLFLEIIPLKLSVEGQGLLAIYDDFIRFILPLAFDFFNTKEIENKNEHIEKIDSIVKNGMSEIAEFYLEHIEKFLKERC